MFSALAAEVRIRVGRTARSENHFVNIPFQPVVDLSGYLDQQARDWGVEKSTAMWKSETSEILIRECSEMNLFLRPMHAEHQFLAPHWSV